MPSEKYQQTIQNLKAELLNAEQENMKGNICKVEQYFFKAYEILQNVLPPIDHQPEENSRPI
jgi:hypothetical protein